MSNLVVASNVKRIIEQKGIKQKSVAEKAGISEKKFSDMLNDRVSIKAEDIVKIQEALQVPVGELFKRG